MLQGAATRGVLCVALLLPIAVPVLAADAALAVTYQEVSNAALGNARTLLQRQAASERASAAGSATTGVHVELLQEINRPQRWALLEWAPDAAALQTIQSAGAAENASLQTLLVAPPYTRSYHELPASASGSTLATDERLNATRNALYALIHLDIAAGQQDPSNVPGAVGQLITGARAATGNLAAEAWEQEGRANHYTLLFVWRRPADHDAFAAGDVARGFREHVNKVLGSPYDERLYRLLN